MRNSSLSPRKSPHRYPILQREDLDVDIEDVKEFVLDPPVVVNNLPGQWTGSKYDLVKVKLSPGEATRISLELKKHLVDNNVLNISQIGLEKELFAVMRKRGFGAEYDRIFLRLQSVYQKRTPVIILIAGTGCVGKSFLATQLAERLNYPNVVQTDLVLDILKSNKTLNLNPLPLPYRTYASEEDLLREYRREAELVRRAVGTDIAKCFKDGKAVIVEGVHVDPSLYIDLFREHSQPKRPIVLLTWVFKMKEKAHRLFVENWLSCSDFDQKMAAQLSEDPVTHTNTIINNYKTIANYVSQFSPPFEQIEVNAQSLPDTLNSLHSLYLEAVEKAAQEYVDVDVEEDADAAAKD